MLLSNALLLLSMLLGCASSSTTQKLTALLPPGTDLDAFSQARELLDGLEQAPSCNRFAAATLVNSCKTLQPDGKDANHALDRIKSSFAARLAVCEILGADAAIPSQCNTMVPIPQDRFSSGIKCRLKNSFCPKALEDPLLHKYAEVDQQQISNCLIALESRPQWWTSYSNARQHAIAICHASQAEVDREAIIQVYSSMKDAAVHISGAFEQQLRDAERFLAGQQAFAQSVRTLQETLLKDLESSHGSATARFTSFLSNVEQQLSTLFSKTQSSINKANEQVSNLGSAVDKSTRGAVEAGAKVAQISKDAQAISSAQSDALAVQKQLTSSLDNLQKHDILNIQDAFSEIATHLATSSEFMALMHDRQMQHDQWLQHLDGAFRHLVTNAMDIQDMQEIQAANQTRIVEAVNTKIEELGSAIDEKTAEVQAMGFFSGMVDWFKIGAVAAAIYAVVAFFNTRLAPMFAAVGTLFYLFQDVIWKGKEQVQDVGKAIDVGAAWESLLYWLPLLIGLVAGLAVVYGLAVSMRRRWMKRTAAKMLESRLESAELQNATAPKEGPFARQSLVQSGKVQRGQPYTPKIRKPALIMTPVSSEQHERDGDRVRRAVSVPV